MPQTLTPSGRRMSTISTQDQELDATSLHTIMTGSNETIISANKSMFFLEMNPFAPVSVVLLHMLCKAPSQVPSPETTYISASVQTLLQTALQGQLAVLRLAFSVMSDGPDRAVPIWAYHNFRLYKR